MKKLIVAAAVAAGALSIAPAVAHAAPGVGGPCPRWHATTHDAAGKTMWCNHTMTGDHDLVWQYGGPSDN